MARAPLTVLVAGGGVVGLATAALIATGRCADRVHVRVLEAGALPRFDSTHFDLRVYALSRASQRVLERLRVWSAIANQRACAYRRMHVWEGDEPFGPWAIDFDSADLGEPDLGHIVEDSLLRATLAALVESLPNAEIATHADIASVEPLERGVRVTLQSGPELSGTLLVAADGTDSPVRARLAIATAERRYEQTALVARVTAARPHGDTAWQRFLPGGPLALLPLSDGSLSIVWSLPTARAEELRTAGETDFVAALQTSSAGVLGQLALAGPRAGFALRALHAWRYTAPRVALVGDAAHTVHPLAGQGMNLGMLDAAALAQTLDAAILRGEDPGDRYVLARYQRARQGDNLASLLAFDGLQRLFRLPAWLVPWRAVGLAAVDRAWPLKHALMHGALGLDSRRKNLLPWSQGTGTHRIGIP